MAITNTQQARQLYIKGGVANPDGRRGFFKGAQDDARAGRGNISPGTDRRGNVRDDNPFTGRDGDGPKGPPSVISKPPKTKTKTKDKDNILDVFNPLSKKRKKFAYNLSMLTPGQIERSKKMQTAYKNYLESMGVSIPSTLTGEEEDLAEFFVESAFNKSVPEDAMLETPQSYGEFIAENFGAPGVMMSGNVGGLEKFVKTRNPDGSPATFGYRNVSDRGDSSILLPQGIMTQAPSTMEQEPEEEDEGLRLAFRADGGRIEAQEGGIMPRLNQLGSGVSSAEQTLQDINQRLESAESSLGGGGGGLGTLAPGVPTGFGSRPLPEFMQSKPQNLEPLQQADPNSSMLFAYDPRGPFNMQDAYSAAQQTAQEQRKQGFAQKLQLPGEMTFENFSNYMNNPQQLTGIPAAGYADGGNVVGGEFDFESARQMYGLGKLVKKVTRTVKKIAKSPVGKVAIAAGIAGLPFGGGKFFGSGSLFGKAKTFFGAGSLNPLLRKTVGGDIAQSAFGSMLSGIPGGAVTAGIVGTSLLAGLLTPEQEEEAQALSRGEGIDIEAARRSILARAQGNIPGDFRARRFVAEGGSMKEPVAKKTMPLLDLEGQEMDLRAEGGFVPIGRMEKADDVPARLSKNEFVFTADAVRNAGDGNVDKGAEVMYNMMKNLEAGGDVSEESQGLEGARKMFQTSQRLEEVL